MNANTVVLGYVERNAAWIKAFMGCVMLAIAPSFMAIIDPGMMADMVWLQWLTVVGLLLGAVCLGFGLFKANTVSSRIFLIVLLALALAAAVEAVIGRL